MYVQIGGGFLIEDSVGDVVRLSKFSLFADLVFVRFHQTKCAKKIPRCNRWPYQRGEGGQDYKTGSPSGRPSTIRKQGSNKPVQKFAEVVRWRGAG